MSLDSQIICVRVLEVYLYLFFFFFKQKTAYEMRISDWSSDVCSSDLQRLWIENRVDPEAVHHAASRCAPAITSSAISSATAAGERRSEERRVGKECVSTCRSRWSPYH